MAYSQLHPAVHNIQYTHGRHPLHSLFHTLCWQPKTNIEVFYMQAFSLLSAV